MERVLITGLTGLIKAPIVEGRNHLTGINVFIQAAIVFGAAVLRMGGCQLCKGFLRSAVLLPAFVDLLCFCFGFLPGLLGCKAVLTVLFVGPYMYLLHKVPSTSECSILGESS